ncbi:hypothetical protein [Fulvivirga lutimaris]|uniref:hypothetical protein n=1 Tax=Fulvivirga lutimaris TaxID=1819566 RepID=UPI0012BD14C8|nr:hypothetical protein [Fulvivirga lutimaris]MTI38433.1 hypothetical protein [Fulvivirga lutimaris]
MKFIKGLVLLAIGGFLIYWAQTHPPTKDLLHAVNNEIIGSYALSKPMYYGTLAVGGILAALGLYRVYKDTK